MRKVPFLKSFKNREGNVMTGVLMLSFSIVVMVSILLYVTGLLTHQIVETRLSSIAYSTADLISETKKVDQVISNFVQKKVQPFDWYMNGYEVTISAYKYDEGAGSLSKREVAKMVDGSSFRGADLKEDDIVEIVIKSTGQTMLSRFATGNPFSSGEKNIKVISVGEAVIDGKPY